MNGDLLITVTRSASSDGAVLVFIDTEGEPDSSDGGPGLRVFVNDADVFTGIPNELDGYREAESVVHIVPIPAYLDGSDKPPTEFEDVDHVTLKDDTSRRQAWNVAHHEPSD